MQKIKFDFEATKERIYAPNSNVPIGAPVDRNGNIANDGNAYGIVLCKETENEKYWVRYNLVVMVAGYCDIIDAQAIWGDEYSAEAMAAMSDITFCDNHELPTGGGGGGGYVMPTILVDEILTEEINGITITEHNGKPLKCKRVVYACVFGSTAGTGTYTMRINGDWAFNNFSGNAGSRTVYEIEYLGVDRFLTKAFANIGQEYGGTNINGGFTNYGDNVGEISKIELEGVFPIGTHIYLLAWGVE